ncbi:hypothetical protein ACIP98_21045 [Streptomyces sp. NPDC088354]|uniref:hypothetical protein n=1 Tax=Streptomyces sp. NPDC088354 TaxID=3365856 RepID=UPI00381694E1
MTEGRPGLGTAERFARYAHQPPAWLNGEDLDDWHRGRARRYADTGNWTARNRARWDVWFLACTPAQRRRLRKKLRRSGETGPEGPRPARGPESSLVLYDECPVGIPTPAEPT